MQERRWFAVAYMFVITACFSSIVIGFAQFTKDDVEANQQLAFEKAILTVLPGLYEPDADRINLHERFVDQVTPPDESSAGAYVLRTAGRTIAYALPFSGQGFWAPIKGAIGVGADRKTITGIYFYEQNETPGLGARITTQPFRDQFVGKVLSASDKPLRFILPGHTPAESDIHTLTGATQTSVRVERMLNTALANWLAQLPQQERIQ